MGCWDVAHSRMSGILSSPISGVIRSGSPTARHSLWLILPSRICMQRTLHPVASGSGALCTCINTLVSATLPVTDAFHQSTRCVCRPRVGCLPLPAAYMRCKTCKRLDSCFPEWLIKDSVRTARPIFGRVTKKSWRQQIPSR